MRIDIGNASVDNLDTDYVTALDDISEGAPKTQGIVAPSLTRYGADVRLAARGHYDVGAWYDLQGVLRLQAYALDLAYLRHWAMARGVGTLLQRALDEAGPSDV